MRIGFLGALAILFIALKLCEVITWSWVLVTLPLWAVPALVGSVIVTFIAVALIIFAIVLISVIVAGAVIGVVKLVRKVTG